MNLWRTITRPPWRTVIPGVCGLVAVLVAWLFWSPGLNVRDGRHDRGSNAIWLAHGWLGADSWFHRYGKTNEFTRYRDANRIKALADKLRRHGIVEVYPHLCPAAAEGNLPAVDATQVERFLDTFTGFQVVPWIGGPNETSVDLTSAKWRATFVGSVQRLLQEHPRFAGVQINIEPMRDGNADSLKFLVELRGALPPGKLLSVAAYPPPTRWHQFPDVHWGENYFREVAKRVDELAVMMYDTSLRSPRLYQKLMADWTEEVLTWSEGRRVLLGVPTYADEGVGYHDPKAENITNALLGIHRGLAGANLPTNYLGVAIYCEWETDDDEWLWFREHFLKP